MRLFLGLDLPSALRFRLADLRGSLPYIHWHDPETYHLTLCFIGNITHYQQMNDLNLALSKITFPRFTLTVETVNYFSLSTDKLVFWAGVHPTFSLMLLQRKLERLLHSLNIRSQNRKFTPHITLAKGNCLDQTQIAKWLHQYNLLKIPDIEITHFSLFSSQPNKRMPHYEIEANYPLS